MAGLEGVQAFPIQVDGSDLNIGIVVAQFNQDIGEAMLDACYSELIRIGVSTENVAIASVPGALEVPLTLQRFADSGRFEALIALGAVIRGDTYHFEIVSNESAAGLTAVQLETGIPIANGILTCENEQQARDRIERKGIDCAQVAVQMARLMEAIDDG